jgi:membrane-associated phospholipid phosphatase
MDKHCTTLVCKSQIACRIGYIFSALTLIAWLILGGYILLQQPPRTTVYLITVMAASFLINTLIKYITQKERPEPLDEFGARFHLGIQKKSFPSCHTQLSFTALTLIYHIHPALSTPATILTITTTFLRHYIGRHWTIDILAAIIIGVLIAMASLLIGGYTIAP